MRCLPFSISEATNESWQGAHGPSRRSRPTRRKFTTLEVFSRLLRLFPCTPTDSSNTVKMVGTHTAPSPLRQRISHSITDRQSRALAPFLTTGHLLVFRTRLSRTCLTSQLPFSGLEQHLSGHPQSTFSIEMRSITHNNRINTRLTHLPPSGPLRRYRNRERQERPRSRFLPPCFFQEHP
jgi:hypothetical protein